MAFLKRKRKASKLYVVKTEITSSYYDGTGHGQQYVTRYFLAKKRKNKYYELFSGEPLKFEADCHSNGVFFIKFNVPYIGEVESISKYSNEKKFTDSELFYFITKLNTIEELKKINKEEPEDDELYEDDSDKDELDEEMSED